MRFLATHELPDEQAEFGYDDLTPGQRFPPYGFALTRDDVLAYVEATEDDLPLYRDEAAARRAGLRGLAAPPTILGIVGLLKAALGRRWPDSTLHLRQTFEFFDYPLVDEPLTLVVVVGPKEERKGRRYLTLIGETHDAAGRLLVGTHSTLLYGWRAPAVGDGGSPVPATARAAGRSAEAQAPSPGAGSATPAQAAAAAGDELPALVRAATRETIRRYALASGGRARIHLDPDYARSVGLPDAVAHGLMVLTYADQMLARALGPTWHRGGRLELTFLAPVLAGSALTVRARRATADDGRAAFELSCTDQGGRLVQIGRATA
ncbi:MAG: MaoC family dehydratase N-terminal domain-containing protein [Chloroflexi bacterium]|nr:MaoC family dehydratase N-terminal domain-containing protein [Chloroflexota bacterium]